MFTFNLKHDKEPISQIQIVGHSANGWSVFFKKVNVLKNQIRGQVTVLDSGILKRPDS